MTAFPLRYIWQTNQGDGNARNLGAHGARGDILAFVDDDIELDPNYLLLVADANAQHARDLIVGHVIDIYDDEASKFGHCPRSAATVGSSPRTEPITPVECLSGALTLARETYFDLGMMQPLTSSGASVWCDVDLAYRASLRGRSTWRQLDAIAYHHDVSRSSVEAAGRRYERASELAPLLFERHPAIVDLLPMYRDMHPISSTDPPALRFRKVMRRLASSRPGSMLLNRLSEDLEALNAPMRWRAPVNRAVMGGYMYRGLSRGRARVQ